MAVSATEKSHLQSCVHNALGKFEKLKAVKAAVGGSINRTYLVTLQSATVLFIKTHYQPQPYRGMYEAEAEALRLISETNTIAVPTPLYADAHCLIEEAFIEAPKGRCWDEELGRGLALLHRATQTPNFGFKCNNFLGSTPQLNTPHTDWTVFWRECRLLPQLKYLAAHLGTEDVLISRLKTFESRLDYFLDNVATNAVLIHGDLWAGNAAAAARGKPIIFDPASYFASHEVEFGMMRLFGGFGRRTEKAYMEIWPLEPEADSRIAIYQLHHILNHLIMFGGGYYAAAVASVDALL